MEMEILSDWNPWWEDASKIDRLKGRNRDKYNYLKNSINAKEITIIVGPRRAGKSTLMYQIISDLLKKVSPKQILFVNFDDKKLKDISIDEIYQTYKEKINHEKKAFVFFDEIHKKDGWENWIRKKYDLKTNDKFVISGSCSYLLKKEYSTLLTGRNLTFDVFPLDFEEFLFFSDFKISKENIFNGIISEETLIGIRKKLEEFLEIGGYPALFEEPEEFKKRLLEQYFDDIIYKDVVDRYGLNSQKTKDVALYLMTNFTKTASLRNIRNSLRISYDTIKDYLSHFKDAFLFFSLDYFSYSYKEQKTRASKIYVIDNGLRNAVSFKFSKDIGKLAENLVFLELIKRKKEIFYWEGKNEVDFVIKELDNSLTAINVSFSDEIAEREFKGLDEIKNKLDIKVNKRLIITKNIEKKEKGMELIPLWKWLLLND